MQLCVFSEKKKKREKKTGQNNHIPQRKRREEKKNDEKICKQFNQFPVLRLALLDELGLVHQFLERQVSPLLFKKRVDC